MSAPAANPPAANLPVANRPVAAADVPCLLVANAPVPGLAKTRLGASVGAAAAADLAAAALLDTLRVCGEVFAPERRFLALTGDLADAARSSDLEAAVESWTVLAQRGSDFSARLAAAHADVQAMRQGPVLQLGMDTPHVHAGLLAEVCTQLASCDAVLGPAADGGWWALAMNDPTAAHVLAGIPTSTSQTGRLTLAALRQEGLRVSLAATLVDVDTHDDAVTVAHAAPHTLFAAAWQQAGRWSA